MTLPQFLKTRQAAFFHDVMVVCASWVGAYWLRFNLDSIPEPFWSNCLYSLPFVLAVQAGFFGYYGLYRGVWRFASLPDLVRILKAVAAAVLLIATVFFLFVGVGVVPRSVFPIYGLLLVALLAGPRFVYRWMKDRGLYSGPTRQVIIVGAGKAGEMLARDMLRDPDNSYSPVAFIDDDRRKHRMDIHGIPVVGGSHDIPVFIEEYEIDSVIIAVPSATSAQMRRIVEVCEESGVGFLTLPKLEDYFSNRSNLTELREVSIDDLLGRDPVVLDWKLIGSSLIGKRILVTGGGGSIGSELCRQLANLNPSELIVFDQSEYNLFEIDRELTKSYPNVNITGCLGDVCDSVAVETLMSTFKPEVIFHAAAYKHVPMLENQVRVAVQNNVLGTVAMAEAAHRHSVATFVLISTDKAVNPSNIMGTTKRTAEVFCQNFNMESDTQFVTVRFGNVLDSAGSVVPIFRQQIDMGGPVTVTHPDVSRYFMTIPEACQLIMQASVLGDGGEIFVLNMGKPIKIHFLAEQMIYLAGKKPGEDIEIIYSGLRPGEKIREELFHEKESLRATRHEQILLAQSREVSMGEWRVTVAGLQDACDLNDLERLKQLLHGLVPESSCFGFAGAASNNIIADNVIPINQ